MKLETAFLNPENPAVHWQKVTLIGVGLLGGSLGMALKRSPAAPEVVGYVRRRASITECKRARAVDVATMNLAAAVSGADLIVFCTPLSRMGQLARDMAPQVAPGCVVTDVGSVKASVIEELEPLFTSLGAHFIGSHPMAGSERMGVSAARPDLFSGAMCVVTPTPKSNRRALLNVKRMWKLVGARLLETTPERHDLWVSRTSHLPHVAAAALASLVLDPSASAQQPRLCANGFRDATRIASGSPEMWGDIAIANRTNLRRSLQGYITELRRLEGLLGRADRPALRRFFERAKQRRDKWARGAITLSPE